MRRRNINTMDNLLEIRPIMSDTVFRKGSNNRIFIVIAVVGCAVFLALGVIIGWFAHPSAGNQEKPGTEGGLEGKKNFSATNYIIKNLNKDNIRENLRRYTEKTRLFGTQNGRELSDMILHEWKQSGIDEAHFASYDVLLSYPNSSSPNKVQILDGTNTAIFTSAPFEKPLTEAENKSGIVPPYNSYAPAGTVEGDLVYVNYGREEDFRYITNNRSYDLTGKIVIARYGKVFRGDKLILAEKYNASGLILYNDPKDFNMNYGQSPYPHSWWLPPSGLQRGTVGTDGDYMTPLYPSLPSAYRIPLEQLKREKLPRIPCQPIGYGDAEELLKLLDGPDTPDSWQGLLPFRYKLGPGFKNKTLKVRLVVHNYEEVRKIDNVIGYVHGAEEPDRYVLLGNHHDAWAFGAVDPLSGSAALTDIVRVYGNMIKEGHRPRRTIVFCSWDAEEIGLLGSTEYVEEKMKILYERAVAYLNVDYAVDYPYTIYAGTSPLLQDPLYAAAKKVPSPENDGTSLYHLWLSRPQDSSQTTPLKEPEVYYSLGSGSDMATFYQRAGVPSVDVWFSYDTNRFPVLSYPTYHSAYETFFMFSNFIDPNFNYTLAMGQFWAILASDLADESLLGMDIRRYANAIHDFVESLLKQFEAQWRQHGVEIDAFISAAHNFTSASNTFMKDLSTRKTASLKPLQIRMLNDRLMQIERAFIDSEGLPGRPQYKHVVFAPSLFDAYTDNSFPGIMDTMYDIQHKNATQEWELLKKQVSIAIYMVQSAANTLADIGL